MNLKVLIVLVSYVYLQTLILAVNASLNCRDENGNVVDWFLLYKLPDEKGKSGHNGTQYMYITPQTASKGWTISEYLVTESESMPAITLKPLYDNLTESLWILYNDQPPDGSSPARRGHTKGVVGVDETGGFWLVHSVPNFPPSPDKPGYSYPETGFKNGQSFLCLSFSKKDIDNVGTQLQYNQINVYWKNIAEDLKDMYPKLGEAASGIRIRHAPWNNKVILTSAAGNEFYSFAKASYFKKDLYEDWVAPELETNLLVESWLNGRGPLPSNCSKKYTVNNVDKVQLCQVNQCTMFTSTKDHSKWAVSASKNNPWLCVGDINRAKSQETRGGGTVCTRNPILWQSYYKSIASIQPCPRHKSLFSDSPQVVML